MSMLAFHSEIRVLSFSLRTKEVTLIIRYRTLLICKGLHLCSAAFYLENLFVKIVPPSF